MWNYLAGLAVFFVIVAAVVGFVVCLFVILDSIEIWWKWRQRHGR